MISRNPTQLLFIGTNTVSYCYKQLSSRQKLKDKKTLAKAKRHVCKVMRSKYQDKQLKFKQTS